MRRIGATILAAVSCLVLSACAVWTDPASNVGALTATLNAQGRTNDTPAHYYFQYATREADLGTPRGQQTPERGPIPPNVPGNGGNVAFREHIGGLTPGTTYYYRVCGSDGQIHPALCARTQHFTTASSPQFSPHLFTTGTLADITSIGSRLYVVGGPCANPPPPPAAPCSFVGSLALDGTKKHLDAPDGAAAITRGPDGDPWAVGGGNGLDTGAWLNHYDLNLGTLPGGVDFGFTFATEVAAADGALWVILTRGTVSVRGYATDGSPCCASYDFDDLDPSTGAGGGSRIATGPDGALWVTTQNAIWRLTTDGQSATEFPLAVGTGAHAIAAGPDGRLWFTAPGRIGRMNTAGEVRYFAVPSERGDNATAQDITAGPDGALWFLEGSANKLGRITTDGTVTEYPVPVGGPVPDGVRAGITVGPDGALWFTDGAYVVRAG